jgi:two-component system sensor histidine kinase UhpB
LLTRPLSTQAEAVSWVLLTDAEGLTTWVSAAFTAATGYTCEDMRGRTPASVLQRPADAAQALRANYRKNGSPYFSRSCVEPQLDAKNRLVGHVWQQSEVTLKVAQQELALRAQAQDAAESQAVELELQQLGRPHFAVDAAVEEVLGAFATAADAPGERERIGLLLRWHRATQPEAAVGFFERDIDSGQGYWDSGMREIWGLAYAGPAPPFGDVQALVLAEDQAAMADAWRQSLQDHKPARLACRVRKPDGAVRWIQADWVISLNGAGRRIVNGSVRDITAAVSAASEAEALRRELLMVADLAHIGLMRVSAGNGALVVNAAARRILGLPANGALQVSEVVARVHPDDLPALDAVYRQGLSGQASAVQLRLRLWQPLGQATHIQIRGEIVRSPQGSAQSVLIALVDVSEATQAQLHATQLSESRAMALELAQLGVWEMPEHGDHVVFDDTLLRIYGWQSRALHVPLRQWMRAVHPQDRRSMRRHWLALQRGQMLNGQAEYRIVRDDGSVRWLVVRATRLQRPDGTLASAFGTTLDVTERVQADQALQQTQHQLRELAAYQLDEFDTLRTQLSRDLHDELGQTLGALAREIDLAQVAAPDAVQRMRALLRTCAASVRDVSRALRPASLDLGLLPALRALASEMSMHGDVDVATELSGALPLLPENQVRALYRIAQEALNNAMRHANAQHVTLGLEYGPEEMSLYIRDDGCGFRTDDPACGRGLGLLGMRERAGQVGTVLSILSAPGQGTTVRAVLRTTSTGGRHDSLAGL